MITAPSLYDLSQKLRLLAREAVVLGPDGRRLSGEIHQEFESARLQLNEFIDQLQDGHLLNDLQQRHVAACRLICQQWHPQIKQLELAFR